MEISRWQDFRSNFPRKLNFWFWHCLFNALPSYVIAVKWLKLWEKPHAQLAMLCAVVVFIFGYAFVTAFFRFLSDGKTIFARALKVGLVVRIVVSFLTVIMATDEQTLLFTPDVWCGILASGLIDYVFDFLGFKVGLIGSSNIGGGSVLQDGFHLFREVFFTTVLQGLILSFGLFMVSFLALLVIQIRDRKKRVAIMR